MENIYDYQRTLAEITSELISAKTGKEIMAHFDKVEGWVQEFPWTEDSYTDCKEYRKNIISDLTMCRAFAATKEKLVSTLNQLNAVLIVKVQICKIDGMVERIKAAFPEDVDIQQMLNAISAHQQELYGWIEEEINPKAKESQGYVVTNTSGDIPGASSR